MSREKTGKAYDVKRVKQASNSRKKDSAQSINSPFEQIVFLQQTLGNQAVQRLFEAGKLPNIDGHRRKGANDTAGSVLRKAGSPAISPRCAQAAGKAIFMLTALGLHPPGASALKQGSKVIFDNQDNKIHRIRMVPTNLFHPNKLIVNPGIIEVTRLSPTTTHKGGSIVDDVPASTSGSVHDVIVCP